MRKCRSCGKEYPDTLAFCPQDFTALEARPAHSNSTAEVESSTSTEDAAITTLAASDEPIATKSTDWLPIRSGLIVTAGIVGSLFFARGRETEPSALRQPSEVANQTTQSPAAGSKSLPMEAVARPAAIIQSQTNTGAPPAEQPVLAPCTAARDPAKGEPLKLATALVDKKSVKPTDTIYVAQAATFAQHATEIDPQCSDAWSILALASYRVAYDICGKGEYEHARAAAEKALVLATEDRVKASTLRTLGRIAASRLQWNEAEQRFLESQASAATNADARSWLAALSVVKSLKPELIAVIDRVVAQEPLSEDELAELTVEETVYVENGVLARNGRRLNMPMFDWLYFCAESPLAKHCEVDLNVARRPIVEGSVDDGNVKLIASVREQLVKAQALANTASEPYH